MTLHNGGLIELITAAEIAGATDAVPAEARRGATVLFILVRSV